MMKKIIIKSLLIAFILIFSMYSVIGVTQTLQTGDISVSGASPVASAARYEPNPIQPGNYVDVWLTIENKGNQVAKNIVVKLTPDYPFFVDQDSEKSKTIGSLGSFQQALTKFKIRVDARAIAGSSPLDFEISYEGSTKPVPARVLIDVRPVDYLIQLENIDVSPSPVSPGSTVDVKIDLHNLGSTVVRSLSAVLSLPTNFVPQDSSNKQLVPILTGGETAKIDYKLAVSPDANSGPVLLPLNIIFFDTDGNQFNQTQNLGLVVGSDPLVSVLVDSSDLTYESEVGEVVLKFVNRGLDDLKFLNVKLKSTDDIEILSNEEVYIGKVDSDDFDTINVKLSLKKKNLRTIKIPVDVEFNDANNRPYFQVFNPELKLFSVKELGQQKSNKFIYLIVVVLIGAVIYWYRRRKKKSKR